MAVTGVGVAVVGSLGMPLQPYMVLTAAAAGYGLGMMHAFILVGEWIK